MHVSKKERKLYLLLIFFKKTIYSLIFFLIFFHIFIYFIFLIYYFLFSYFFYFILFILFIFKVAVNVSGGEQTFPQIMADFSLSVH